MNRMLLAFVVVLTLAAAAPSYAGPASPIDGRWVIGETDGDDFDKILEVSGKTATLRPFGRTEGADSRMELTVELMPGTKNHYRMRFRPQNEALIEIHFRPVSGHEAVTWLSDRWEVHEARRVGTLPKELLGEWGVWPGGGELQKMRFTPTSMVATFKDGPRTADLLPLVSAGGTVDYVTRMRTREHEVFRLMPAGDGAYLMWERETGDSVVLHRPGKRPAWLPEKPPRGDIPRSTPSPVKVDVSPAPPNP